MKYLITESPLFEVSNLIHQIIAKLNPYCGALRSIDACATVKQT
ncbi:hypothetical protein C4J90_3430 [Pseudomonas sp. R2-60-08W]|nr:hypothetical protein C4J90_3430 [Pseudomonas sp. R2-60-08W]